MKFKDFENNYDGNSVNEFGEIKYLSAQSLVNKKTLEVTRVQTNDSIIRDIEGNHAGMVIILRKSKIEEQLGISNLSLLKA